MNTRYRPLAASKYYLPHRHRLPFKVWTAPEAAALSVQASTQLEATACNQLSTGKPEQKHTTNPVSHLSLIRFTEQSYIAYFKPEPLKLFS